MAFVKFINVMKRIKGFIRNVSKLQGYKRFLQSSSIKDKFNDLVNSFEIIIKDLNF